MSLPDGLRNALGGPVPTRATDPSARLRQIAEAILKVVEDSYSKHPMAHRTSQEDTRRATVCTTWFNRLVNQHRWTHDRALSEMRFILNTTLEGREYTPPPTSQVLWVPDRSLLAPAR